MLMKVIPFFDCRKVVSVIQIYHFLVFLVGLSYAVGLRAKLCQALNIIDTNGIVIFRHYLPYSVTA